MKNSTIFCIKWKKWRHFSPPRSDTVLSPTPESSPEIMPATPKSQAPSSHLEEFTPKSQLAELVRLHPEFTSQESTPRSALAELVILHPELTGPQNCDNEIQLHPLALDFEAFSQPSKIPPQQLKMKQTSVLTEFINLTAQHPPKPLNLLPPFTSLQQPISQPIKIHPFDQYLLNKTAPRTSSRKPLSQRNPHLKTLTFTNSKYKQRPSHRYYPLVN